MAIQPLDPYKSLAQETFEGRQFNQFMSCSRRYHTLTKQLAEELTPDEANAITTQMHDLQTWLNDYIEEQSRIRYSGVAALFQNELLETFQVLSQKYSALAKELSPELTQDQCTAKMAQIRRIRTWLDADVAKYPEHQAHLPEGYETGLYSPNDMRFQKIVRHSQAYCDLVREFTAASSEDEAAKKSWRIDELHDYLKSQDNWLREYLAKYPEFLSQIPEGHLF